MKNWQIWPTAVSGLRVYGAASRLPVVDLLLKEKSGCRGRPGRIRRPIGQQARAGGVIYAFSGVPFFPILFMNIILVLWRLCKTCMW